MDKIKEFEKERKKNIELIAKDENIRKLGLEFIKKTIDYIKFICITN